MAAGEHDRDGLPLVVRKAVGRAVDVREGEAGRRVSEPQRGHAARI
jgi:hypothetical protein